jgi:hypothetical protein
VECAGYCPHNPSGRKRGFLHAYIGKALQSCAINVAKIAGTPALVIDADPNAEAFYLAFGARRVGVQPALIDGEPNRVRPQLLITLT